MSVEFQVRDYFYPFEIMKLKRFLNASQWFNRRQLEVYQFNRLKLLLKHAYDNVLYYRRLFDETGFTPEDFKSLDDLQRIPVSSKSDIKKNADALVAKNAKRFSPSLTQTSGSSGEKLTFYLDRPSRILEFCYYWRYWGWAGYRLGMPFAEFSLHHFLNHDTNAIIDYCRLSNRLILNPVQLSLTSLEKYVKAIRKTRAIYLKGSPSSIHVFCLLLEEAKISGIRFKAVFTTGELLMPVQRKKIEEVLGSKIYDSFGHMERTVAISQCPYGTYHVHSEYGVLEIDRSTKSAADGKIQGVMIGTSLHNYAMPFIRYKLDDLVVMDPQQKECRCGRKLPVANCVLGRRQDVVVTRDGRMITNLFILINFVEGLQWFQLVQESLDHFELKVKFAEKDSSFAETKLSELLKRILGSGVRVEMTKISKVEAGEGKYRPVISKISPRCAEL